MSQTGHKHLLSDVPGVPVYVVNEETTARMQTNTILLRAVDVLMQDAIGENGHIRHDHETTLRLAWSIRQYADKRAANIRRAN